MKIYLTHARKYYSNQRKNIELKTHVETKHC